ncbi:MAG: extracellular solute-binding protein [Clostridiaceae bacterium]|nr:extracellular solute-binding protein [Clostridiaceae bacterium]
MNSQFLKRAASIVVSGLMITSLLVGCGPKDEPITNVEPSASVEPSKDPGGDTPKELKGEFTFWHFNKDEGPLLAKAFEDKYPGVKINVQITADSDMAYQNKVTAALRAGKGMPDLYAVESAYVKRFVNMPGGFEDLSAAPYNAEELTSKMISYTIDIGRSDDGKIRGFLIRELLVVSDTREI